MSRLAIAAGFVLLGCLSGGTRADVLSELPATLQSRLVPVAEVSLAALDSDSRQQLRTGRAQVASAIEAQVSDADLAGAYGELGALYQSQHVNRLAGDCYTNARRLAPQEFRWLYYSAYLAATIGDLEGAIAGYEAARKLRPDYLALTLRLADAWRESDRLDQAAQAYQSVVDSKGLEAAARFGLGQIAQLRRNYATAIRYFERTLALQPQASRVHYTLGQALQASGDTERAKQEFAQMGDVLPSFTDPLIKSLLALQQGSHIHFITAMKAARKQDFAAARDAFAAGLAREPGNANARVSYARALYLTGDRAQAQRELHTVVSSTPSNAMAWFLLGILAEEDDDSATAVKDYRAALRAEPGHAGAEFYLGNDCYRHGRYDEAATHYAASVAAAPDNLPVYLPYVGALLQGRDGPARARAVLDRARMHFPEDVLLGFLQSQLQSLSGDRELAQAALARARKQEQRQATPPNRELLALALAATGDFQQAAKIQDTVVTEAAWAMPTEAERLGRVLADYRAGRLPAQQDLFTWSQLQPPRVQGRSVFLVYPAARPY
jgi:tetratricopeptide (TPR) repeat protein